MKVSFNKPILDYIQQIDLLNNRGLIITDEKKALHILSNISYYRLSGYWYPLLEVPKTNHQFKKGATFMDAFSIYCFDRELRKLILSELEKIEVAIKTKIAHELDHSASPYWYTDKSLFNFKIKIKDKHNNYRFYTHEDLMTSIQREFIRSDEKFIRHFKDTYIDLYPPAWIIFEILSFGTLSQIYSGLISTNGKKKISNAFGIDDSVLSSWIHSLVYLRNVCAHHSRVWNRNVSISPTLPNRTEHAWIKNTTIIDKDGNTLIINKRIYFFLCIMIYLLRIISPNNTFKIKLFDLFSKYSNVDKQAMGFPKNWDSEPLWV